MTVFVSCAIGAERLPFAAESAPSPERLRWRELASRYRQALSEAGEVVREVVRPEIYQAPESWRELGAAPGDWHLALKPLSHLRPFHGLPNVAVVSDLPDTWEHAEGFPLEPRAMLLRADAVLCTSEASARDARLAGHPRVVVLPAEPEGGRSSFLAGLAALKGVLR